MTTIRVGERNISFPECQKRCSKQVECYGVYWGNSPDIGCDILAYPSVTDHHTGSASSEYGLRYVSTVPSSSAGEIWTIHKIRTGLSRLDFFTHSDTGFGEAAVLVTIERGSTRSWSTPPPSARSSLLPPLQTLNTLISQSNNDMILGVGDGVGDTAYPFPSIETKPTLQASLDFFQPVTISEGYLSGSRSSLDHLQIFKKSLNQNEASEIFHSYARAVRPRELPIDHVFCSTSAANTTNFLRFKCSSSSTKTFLVVQSDNFLQIKHLQVLTELQRLSYLNVEVLGDGSVPLISLEPARNVTEIGKNECFKLDDTLLTTKITNFNEVTIKEPEMCADVLTARPQPSSNSHEMPFKPVSSSCYNYVLRNSNLNTNIKLGGDGFDTNLPSRCWSYCRDTYNYHSFALHVFYLERNPLYKFPSECLCAENVEDLTSGGEIPCSWDDGVIKVFTSTSTKRRTNDWFCDYRNAIIMEDDDCDGDTIKDKICVYWDQHKLETSDKSGNLAKISLRTSTWMSSQQHISHCSFENKKKEEYLVPTELTAKLRTENLLVPRNWFPNIRQYPLRCGNHNKNLPKSLTSAWAIQHNLNDFVKSHPSDLDNFEQYCDEVVGNYGNISVTKINASAVLFSEFPEANNPNNTVPTTQTYASINGLCYGNMESNSGQKIAFKYDVRSCTIIFEHSDRKITKDTCDEIEYVGCYDDTAYTSVWEKVIPMSSCETQASCNHACAGYIYFALGQSLKFYDSEMLPKCTPCNQCYCANTNNFMQSGRLEQDKCSYTTTGGSHRSSSHATNQQQGAYSGGCTVDLKSNNQLSQFDSPSIATRTGNGGVGYFSVYKRKSVITRNGLLTNVVAKIHYTTDKTWPLIKPIFEYYPNTKYAKETTFKRPSVIKSIYGPIDLSGAWKLTRSFDLQKSNDIKGVPVSFSFQMKLYLFGRWPRPNRNKNLIVHVAGKQVFSLGGDLLCTAEPSAHRWNGKVTAAQMHWNVLNNNGYKDASYTDICYSLIKYDGISSAASIEVTVQVVGKTTSSAFVGVQDSRLFIGKGVISEMSTSDIPAFSDKVSRISNTSFVVDAQHSSALQASFVMEAKMKENNKTLYGSSNTKPSSPLNVSCVDVSSSIIKVNVMAMDKIIINSLIIEYARCKKNNAGCLLRAKKVVRPSWTSNGGNLFVTTFSITVAPSLEGMPTKLFVRACNIFDQCSPSTSAWSTSMLNILLNDVNRSSLSLKSGAESSFGELTLNYMAPNPREKKVSIPLTEFWREINWDVSARYNTTDTLSSYIGCFNFTKFSSFIHPTWDEIREQNPSTESCLIACRAQGFEFMALNAFGCMCGSVFEVNIFNATQVGDDKCGPVCLFEKTLSPKRYCGNNGNSAIYRVNILKVAASPFFTSVGQSRYGVTTANNYKVLCQNGGFVVYSQSRITTRFQEYSKNKCARESAIFHFAFCGLIKLFFPIVLLSALSTLSLSLLSPLHSFSTHFNPPPPPPSNIRCSDRSFLLRKIR
jgi:hypothetical protein